MDLGCADTLVATEPCSCRDDDATWDGAVVQAYPPILQLAFQYTVLVPEFVGEADKDGKRPVRYVQSRRLRLRTMSLKLATTAKEVRRSPIEGIPGGGVVLSEGSSLSPGKRLHHQRSSKLGIS
jgi:hypothetical protein